MKIVPLCAVFLLNLFYMQQVIVTCTPLDQNECNSLPHETNYVGAAETILVCDIVFISLRTMREILACHQASCIYSHVDLKFCFC
jgi:hypothetical protein